ncbi:MAG TPA: DivIVA domain-containing protein [Thermomonospora sp.]|nr:DivIVA domain-containing protein [Thermomonospora sp.]
MPRFPVVLRGYDCAQVDALTARIDRALRDGSGGLTADDVLRSRFAVVLRGYDQAAVDRFLYACIDQLRARAPRPAPRSRVDAGRLIAWIENVRFSGAGARSGYDVREVDAFLDRVVAGLRGLAPPLTARDVRTGAFRRVRLGPGYDEGEVRHFLARLADVLEGSPAR